MLTTYETWQKHQQYHAVEGLENDCELPPPAKKAKSDSGNISSFEQYDETLSAVPGPSHWSPPQIGHGASQVHDSSLSYRFEKVGEKTFKNGVIDRHYRVKFNPHESLEGQNLSSLHNQLEDMFDDVIDKARGNLDGADLARVIIHHPKLDINIYFPLRQIDHLSGHDVLEHFENVLSSHQDLDMNDSFHVDVGTMELPKGGAKLPITSLVGDDNSLARKRSIIQINNSDNSCLAAAVGVAYAAANTISTQEWKDLTKRDQSLSMPKLLLKYGKCPVWYKKHLSQRQKKQDDLARFLCREANADHWRPLTICDISKLEELLTVDILVVSARLGNKFIRVPSDENSYRQRLYLYLVEHDKTYHFHVISNISAFTSGSHFCKRRLKPYNKKHQCAISCFMCKRKENCFASDDKMSCRNCHFTCKSLSCFENHKTAIGQKQSPCDRWWKCTTCKKIVDKKQQNVVEHTCDTYFCESCEKTVDVHSHNCYIRSCMSKENLPRFIFFDFECEQECDAIECEEGFLPTKESNCTLCEELKTLCTNCSVCRNCQRADCGKKTHAPNLAVATSVCEMCIDNDDFSPKMMMMMMSWSLTTHQPFWVISVIKVR